MSQTELINLRLVHSLQESGVLNRFDRTVLVCYGTKITKISKVSVNVTLGSLRHRYPKHTSECDRNIVRVSMEIRPWQN